MTWIALIVFALIIPASIPLVLKRYQESSRMLVFGSAFLILALGLAAAVLGALDPVTSNIPLALLIVLGVLVSAFGGGPMTVAILRASHRVDVEQSTEPTVPAVSQTVPGAESISVPELESLAEDNTEHDPVLRGGLWIGLLERIAVTTTLFMGWPEGIALVLGVKGLGRYKELGKEGAAERFILGTFASVLWACACFGIVQLLI